MPESNTIPKKQEKNNGHALHPIINKGGEHEKTGRAKRKVARHEINCKIK